MSVSEERKNHYTGSLKVSRSVVTALVGFDITYKKINTTKYTGKVKSGKLGYLQRRKQWTQHKVKQEYVVGYPKARKVMKTKYVYPRKAIYSENRIAYKK